MKNKKGFTLVELLAVIVILGILLMIGNMSIDAIALNVRKNQHENLVKKIKIAAEKYFDDKHVTSVNVITLIENGYLTADNDKHEVKSPETGEDLKCYIVSKNGEEINFNQALCNDDASVENMDIKIVYCFDEAGTNCYSINDSKNDEWQNGMKKTGSGGTAGIIYLRAYRVSKEQLLSSGKFKWTNPINPDQTYNTASVKIDFRPGSSNNGAFNELFQLSYTENNKEYIATKQVKLDSIKPTCSFNNKEHNRTTFGVKYNLNCNDTGGSEVRSCDNDVTKTTITYQNKTTTQTYNVVDNASNSNTCTITILPQAQEQNCTSCKACYDAGCADWDTKSNCDKCGESCAWSPFVPFNSKTNVSGDSATERVGCTHCTTCGNYSYTCSKSTYECSCNSCTYCASYNRNCTTCKGCDTWSGSWSDVTSCTTSYSKQCQTIYYFS